MSLRASLWFSILLLSMAPHAIATDNYAYQRGEYAVISDGRSPDGHWSITAHGNGPYGYDAFNLYLMREHAHEKPAPLRTGDHLDTGPLSIVGLWAPDSSHFAILYRSDRHVLDLRLFTITNGKAQYVEIPSLVNIVGNEHFRPKVNYQLFSRIYRVTWQKPNYLNLNEVDTFDASETIFRAGLEHYVQVAQLGAKRVFTQFAASAVCEIAEDGKPRFSEIKPLPDFNGTVIYSPHLRFEPQRGLYNTETTLSSMAAQKRPK